MIRRVAEDKLELARADEQMASALEVALLKQMSGTGGMSPASFLEDPTTVTALERVATSSMPINEMALGPMESTGELVDRIRSGDWGPRTYAASTVPDTDARPNDAVRPGPGGRAAASPPHTSARPHPDAGDGGTTVRTSSSAANFDLAAETAEGAIKPAGDIGLADAEAKAQTIASWLKCYRQLLADVPGLDQVLRDRLTYSCCVVLRLRSWPATARA